MSHSWNIIDDFRLSHIDIWMFSNCNLNNFRSFQKHFTTNPLVFFPLLNDETLITSMGNLTICYLYFSLRSVCKHVHFIYFKLLFRCMCFSFLYFHTFFSSFVDCARALINPIFLILFSFRRSESISRFCSFQHRWNRCNTIFISLATIRSRES